MIDNSPDDLPLTHLEDALESKCDSPNTPSPSNKHKVSGNKERSTTTAAVPIQDAAGTPGIDDLLCIDSITGYKYTLIREILYWTLVVITCGLIYVGFHWFKLFQLRLRRKLCTLSEATVVLVYGNDKRFEICNVTSVSRGGGVDKLIIFRFTRFFYDVDQDAYIQPKIRTMYNIEDLYNMIDNGINNDMFQTQTYLFGNNFIDIPLRSIPRLLMEEVLHPFFIFQLYSVILWMNEQYYYYAAAIFLIASVSSCLSLKEIRSNLISLKKMASFNCDVNVLRNGAFSVIPSRSLVPGDIVQLKQDSAIPCDMSLLHGQIICNESMLTGESVPVTKHPLLTRDQVLLRSSLAEPINIREARSCLYGGTVAVKIIPPTLNAPVLAIVKETGFQTSKGKLIMSILYPKKSHFKFVQESFKFIGVLCFVALIGFAVAVWRLRDLGNDAGTIALRALDLITIVIPPALPLAMSVGTGFAMVRLRKRKIFCISPPRLNMGGKIQVFCFDKTGTLTEEGLDFYAVLAATPSTDSSPPFFGELLTSIDLLDHRVFKMIMAACHSLTRINNSITGDPLEVKIFQASGAYLNESPERTTLTYEASTSLAGENLTYIERFDFQSSLQRMSVLVSTAKGEGFSFVKGSPEIIKTLSVSSSIPADYDQQLSRYTEKGYRVLGCAYKTGNYANITNREQVRAEAEQGLVFVGFIIMENKMKPESKGIIATLHRANIRTIMVTGDNPLTAVSVAKQCEIVGNDAALFIPYEVDGDYAWRNITESIDQDTLLCKQQLDQYTLKLENDDVSSYSLAVTGPYFKRAYTNYLHTGNPKFIQMLRRGVIYARMSPDQKQTLVEELQRIGLYVGMCGDGANDCGALKSAHVGVSLSETEASIAAPFTSTTPNISCCPTVIKEGRASLAVSFKLFQFMGMYSLIQFMSVILLYFIGSVLGNWQYLYQDLWVIFPLVIFMGMTKPSEKLSKRRPSGRLISGAIVGSVLVHVLVCFGFQLFVFFLVRSQSWYNEDVVDEDFIVTYLTTALFVYGNFQYLIMALSFSFGKPFLRPLYTNSILFVIFLIALSTSILLLFVPTDKVWEFAQMLVFPVSFRFILFGIIGANLVANIFVEFSFVFYKLRSKKKKNFQYNIIFNKQAPKDPRITDENMLL
ncbi:hypothetical protein SAMD00019534_092660 [Acytostelium subglobosum LB1]|uniref:hypothetical protein n=1 Tax=Acytostelium subglobosum LB1 TaxID=1410327 RepID=UPI000644E03A|nr:hypothetical protein SAMD00019534_092660 [Acytostelium subglobosum LB1]GAM26091.1 hypothetical protein SAMD00019534_092660 [Acytostelium subglobosum LB1]|eukprot:XP_012751134.1 hypothetical protein SAMD00019534_092660 [Acytostelium subglobosum LB1]